MVVTENGSLESANNAMVRCQVEALIGTVGGARTGGQGGAQGARGGQGGGMATTGSGASGSSAQGGAATSPAPATTKTAKPGAISTTTTGTSSSTSSAGANQAVTTGATAAATTTRPSIRSFSFEVVPHVPLRPKTVTTVQQPKSASSSDPSMGAGGGRNRQNASLSTEKPGSTRIISILPEGTRVEAGDVVCRLDASAFED